MKGIDKLLDETGTLYNYAHLDFWRGLWYLLIGYFCTDSIQTARKQHLPLIGNIGSLQFVESLFATLRQTQHSSSIEAID